jgi:hypothetical protein
MKKPKFLPHLIQEAMEVGHAASKAQIYGLDSRHPNGGPTNLHEIEAELGDLMEVADQFGVNWAHVEKHRLKKREKLKEFGPHRSVKPTHRTSSVLWGSMGGIEPPFDPIGGHRRSAQTASPVHDIDLAIPRFHRLGPKLAGEKDKKPEFLAYLIHRGTGAEIKDLREVADLMAGHRRSARLCNLGMEIFEGSFHACEQWLTRKLAPEVINLKKPEGKARFFKVILQPTRSYVIQPLWRTISNPTVNALRREIPNILELDYSDIETRTIALMTNCPNCKGTGRDRDPYFPQNNVCTTCKGTGRDPHPISNSSNSEGEEHSK